MLERRIVSPPEQRGEMDGLSSDAEALVHHSRLSFRRINRATLFSVDGDTPFDRQSCSAADPPCLLELDERNIYAPGAANTKIGTSASRKGNDNFAET